MPEVPNMPGLMQARTPSPDLMGSIEPPPVDVMEKLEAKKDDHSVILETVEPIIKSRDNPTPPPSPSEEPIPVASTTSEVTNQPDLLADFASPNNLVQQAVEEIAGTTTTDASKSSFTEFEAVPKEIEASSLEASLITTEAVEIDSSLVQHVAATSLEEHEQELANLLKEAQRDEDSPVQELEDVLTREKDEGDPWVLDENKVASGAISEVADNVV